MAPLLRHSSCALHLLSMCYFTKKTERSILSVGVFLFGLCGCAVFVHGVFCCCFILLKYSLQLFLNLQEFCIFFISLWLLISYHGTHYHTEN